MDVRQLYGYDSDAVSAASALVCSDKSLALQSQSEDADINVIVRRFGLTGVLPGRSSLPLVTNGDFQDVVTLADALEIIRTAEQSFSALPADVRKRFSNDPAEFVDFCSRTDEDSVRDMIKMGLAVERVIPKEVIQKVEIVAGIPPAAVPPK